MVAIITRETDHGGRENVARLREEFGDAFLHFFHILDPLEPGIVVGKSSAMAYGGRWLYRELTRLGFDPREVLVTDLDSDYRVHPGYFGYLSWTFLTDPDRFRRLYQPVPMFHNNLWETPLPVRLVAVGATHVQMWRVADAREAHQLLVLLGHPPDRPRGRLLGDRRDPRGQPLLLEVVLPLLRASSGRCRSSSRSTATRCGPGPTRARSSSSTPRSDAGRGA